jgi:aminoglycoside phosphotransferase (APT) family kinase protein
MDENAALAAVARRIVDGGRLLRWWPLSGGTSAIMRALEIRGDDGEVRRLVVRRHASSDWKSLSSNVTATEFGLLEALHAIGFEVPEPCSLDDSGELLPSPYYVMKLVEGTTELNEAAVPDAMRQMADFLARLHALPIEHSALPALPEREDPRTELAAYLPTGEPWDRLADALADKPTRARPRALLHGDFWPGNVLWSAGRIAAVIDWEDTALGDPLSDLACARVELLCQHGEAAMHAFTERYLAAVPPPIVDPEALLLWEVYVSAAALASMANWGLEPDVEAHRRASTRRFMERACQELLAALG